MGILLILAYKNFVDNIKLFQYEQTNNRSSMSFLHLMQWHSEWVHRLNHWEQEDVQEKTSSSSDQNNNKASNPSNRRRKHIPFIVVANKLDLLERGPSNTQQLQSSFGQKRRSVLGFVNGEYRGKELVYEYAAENIANIPGSKNESNNSKPSPTAVSSHQANNNDRLTYSLKETLWSTDAAYLNALQLTEDQLPANRRMILLWCQRNGIPHVEASALDGRGVEEAFESIIKVGVEELGMRGSEEAALEVNTESGVDLSAEEDECNHYEEVVVPKSSIVQAEHDIGESNNNQQHNGTYAGNNNDGTSIENPAENGEHIYQQYHHVAGEQDENTKQYDLNNMNDTNIVAAAQSAHNNIDPSQYYFVYQPRQKEENLDLFARYSPKDEQRCSLLKCWMTFLSSCQK